MSTILITGGAKRVGKEIAIKMARLGYNIALHYNSSHKEAKKLSEEIKSLNVKIKLYQGNLNDIDFVTSLIANVHYDFPDLNLLINNASLFERISFLETTPDDFDQHFNANLRAIFFLSQNFAKICKSGNIININDTKITANINAYFSYMLSKKSLHNLTKMTAKELAPKIKVNELCLGTILADKNIENPEKFLEQVSNKLPSEKNANINDIITTIKYIIENNISYGESFFINGGEHLL